MLYTFWILYSVLVRRSSAKLVRGRRTDAPPPPPPTLDLGVTGWLDKVYTTHGVQSAIGP